MSLSDEEDSEGTSRHDRLAVGGPRGAAVTELDEVVSEDMVFLLMSAPEPEGVACSTTQFVPGMLAPSNPVLEQLCVVQRRPLAILDHATQQLAQIMDSALERLWFRARSLAPCRVSALRIEVTLPDDEDVQVTLTGTATSEDARRHVQARRITPPAETGVDDFMFPLDAQEAADPPPAAATPLSNRAGLTLRLKRQARSAPAVPSVFLTSCEAPLGFVVERAFGYISIVLIRESSSLREEHGSLSGMLHTFLTEANTVLRAYVAALGGNALVAMRMTICDLSENREKGQCLLCVSGDAVLVAEAEAEAGAQLRTEGTEV